MWMLCTKSDVNVVTSGPVESSLPRMDEDCILSTGVKNTFLVFFLH